MHVDDIVRALETLEAGAVALGLAVHQGVAVEAATQAAAAVPSPGQELATAGATA